MAGFEGALPLDAFDVCAANPAREHVAEPDAALKLVEELSNGQALRKIKLSNKSYGAKAATATETKNIQIGFTNHTAKLLPVEII